MCIVIRFITNNVNERLIALMDCRSGTGNNLCGIVCDVLKNLNLDVKNCIGSSTDCASNMHGQYNSI